MTPHHHTCSIQWKKGVFYPESFKNKEDYYRNLQQELVEQEIIDLFNKLNNENKQLKQLI